jgi:predicted nucleic acid-binding protein
MARVFWDTMLFVYLMEDDPAFAPRVREVLQRSCTGGDTLLTSHLAIGEVMAGIPGDRAKVNEVRTTIDEMGLAALPFVAECVSKFAHLRSVERLKAPDSIHLSCASVAGVDLFLTNDNLLLRRKL